MILQMRLLPHRALLESRGGAAAAANTLLREATHLGFQGRRTMEKVKWSDDAMPENAHLAQLMYALRLGDPDNTMLDSVMLYDLIDSEAEALPMLDAMVVEVNRMSITMEKLQRDGSCSR
jgi:hypothetical protein